MATMQDVLDPARRQLLQMAEESQASAGQMQTAQDLPQVNVPSQFDTPIQATGGVREAILAGVQGNFETNMAAVQESALQNRRFNVGSTGDAELAVARSSRNEAVAKLGEAELTARGQLLSALTPIATQEAAGEQQRTTIGSQSAADIASIKESGAQTRETQSAQISQQGQLSKELQTLVNSGGISQIEAQGIQQRMNIGAQGATDVAAIKITGAETRETQAAQITAQGQLSKELQTLVNSGAISQIEAQGIQQRMNIGAETTGQEALIKAAAEQERVNIAAKGEVDKAIASLQLSGALDQIGAQGAQARLTVVASATAEADLIARKAVEDRKLVAAQGEVQAQTVEQQNKAAMDRLNEELNVKRLELDVAQSEGRENRQLEREAYVLQATLNKAELDNRLAVAGVSAESQQAVAALSASTDLSIAQIAQSTNLTISQAELAMEKYRVDSDLTISQRYASVQERQVAVAEKDQAATESINLHRLALEEKVAEQGMKVTEAQITGIWQEYGVEEMGAFQDSFNKKNGDTGYNARYDMDGNGVVNFTDFTSFTRLATTGVPTVQAQQLREGARQFDVANEQSLDTFEAQLAETARQYNLSQYQQRELTILSLNANEAVANSQLNVQHLGNLLDFVVNAPEALTPEDGAAVIAAAFDLSRLAPALASDTQTYAAVSAISQINERKGPAAEAAFQLVAEGDVWNPDVFDRNRTQDPSIAQAYQMLDFNQDGLVDMKDYEIYTVSGGTARTNKPVTQTTGKASTFQPKESDFGLMQKAYNSKQGDANFNPEMDFDGDGMINFNDYKTFAERVSGKAFGQ